MRDSNEIHRPRGKLEPQCIIYELHKFAIVFSSRCVRSLRGIEEARETVSSKGRVTPAEGASACSVVIAYC